MCCWPPPSRARTGKLDTIELEWDRRPALGVVMAAHGYPLNPRKGDVITGLPADKADVMVFHAGTALKDGAVVTTGRPGAVRDRTG